jgi:hypothetical protein
MSETTNAPARPHQTRRVVLSRIHKDPAYQVRSKLDVVNVERLRRAYESGRSVTPITVAVIEGQANPVLIDGWHRVEAMLSLGWAEAEAVVVEATAQEAKWLAASANLNHGLPLKKAEQRKAFKAFIRARKHRVSRWRGPTLLSYREIAPEIGVNYSTIRRWMMKDFPKIAAEMADGEGAWKGKGGLDEQPAVKASEAGAKIAEAWETIREAFKAANDPMDRGRLIEAAEATLRELKDMGNWTAPDF